MYNLGKNENLTHGELSKSIAQQSSLSNLRSTTYTTSLAYILRNTSRKWKEQNVLVEGNQLFMPSWRSDEILNNLMHDTNKSLKLHKWKANKTFKADIHYFGHQEPIDRSLASFIINIKENFRKLERLSLKFPRCLNITDEDLEMLSFKISRYLVNLHHLSLNFSECDKVTDTGLILLVTELGKYLGKIQSLKLNFQVNDNISDKGLNALSSVITRHFTKLKSLKLNFSLCGNITDKGLLLLNLNFQKRLANLKHLALSFESYTWSTKNLEELLASTALNLPSLETFSLNLKESKLMKDQGEVYKAHSRNGKSNLKCFKLNLQDCSGLTDLQLEELGFILGQYFSTLEVLDLDFDSCSDVTNQGFIAISSDISTTLINLQHLKLNFSGCEGITKESLKTQERMIRSQLLNLRSFDLIIT